MSNDEEGVQLSRKNAIDVNQKVEIYRTLHELNSVQADAESPETLGCTQLAAPG